MTLAKIRAIQADARRRLAPLQARPEATRQQLNGLQALAAGPELTGGTKVNIHNILVSKGWARYLGPNGKTVHEGWLATYIAITKAGAKVLKREG